ncbi:DUF1365 domain-containing protein [Celerinatantimonas yamalensis]|uniref:DUF1365 domain-containing protein n=1 Tax=Celerinatantimonas yamalensis TaxID=559956 RepID=A0ABW9G4J8_9GAMM
MSLNSAIVQGTTYHQRIVPKHHQFSYPISYLWLDLDETVQVQAMLNQHRWPRVRLHNRDYLGNDARPIKDKALAKLGEFISDYQPQQVVLMAQLRWFGIYFSPINFVFFGDAQQFRYALVEVSNTPWLEKHYYCLDLTRLEPVAKRFHVSPFNPMDMNYHWQVELADTIRIQIDCHRKTREFSAGMTLQRIPLNVISLRQFVRHHPFQSALVIMRIYYQALRLWLKQVPFYGHPNSKKSD